MTITDNNNDGKLTANGGAGSAGIGGGFGNDGQVAITGGEITASAAITVPVLVAAETITPPEAMAM